MLRSRPDHDPHSPASSLPLRSPRRRTLSWVLLLTCSVIWLAGCAALDRQQREWIFQPSDRTWQGGLRAAEGLQDVWIDFQPPERSSAPKPVRLHALWLP